MSAKQARKGSAAERPGWVRVNLGEERKAALEGAAKDLDATVKGLVKLAVDEVIDRHRAGQIKLVATG